MSRAPRSVPVLVSAAALAVALLGGCVAEQREPAGPTGPDSGSIRSYGIPDDSGNAVTVGGAVHEPFQINVGGLAKSPGYATEEVTWWGGPGVGTRFEKHTERGLDLGFADPFGSYDAGPAGTPVQAAVLLVIGADGAMAALSYVEVTRRPRDDSSRSGVLLSYEEDGRPLARPRLIVIGDRTADRAIRDVVEMRLVRLDR